jgi:hypothetical protein
MSTASAEHQFADAFDDVKTAYGRRPERFSQAVETFADWFQLVFIALISTLEKSFTAIALHIDTLNELVEDSRSATARPPPSSASAQPGTTAPTGTPNASRRPPRCTLCHARGHSHNECRTKDASAMRKRVARNSRLAKEARAYVVKSHLPAPPPPLHHFAYPPYPHVSQAPINVAALTADSTELRRRAAQSFFFFWINDL